MCRVCGRGTVRVRVPERETCLLQNIAKALARSPQNLVELHVGQLQRLSDRSTRLLVQIETLEHLAVALYGQMIHEITHVLRELLVVETLFQRQRLILEVGE